MNAPDIRSIKTAGDAIDWLKAHPSEPFVSVFGARAMADDFKRRAEERAPVRQEHGTGLEELPEEIRTAVREYGEAEVEVGCAINYPGTTDKQEAVAREKYAALEQAVLAALRASRGRRGGQP